MSGNDYVKGGSKKIKAYSLGKSPFFKKTFTPTRVPVLNLALSGDLGGGIAPGLTVVAGPSRHFKSNTCLVAVESYLRKHPNATCIFYDSEFGTPPEYWESQGIDPDRIVHVPIMNIEQMKFDCAQRLDSYSEDDEVIIFVDSVGNLASKKEAEDALKENSAADMTRAKQLKSFFRIVTPYLTQLRIPMLVVAHTYDTMDLFPKKIISGGTGILLSADTAIIMGRRQQKEGTDLTGYEFVMNIEKSRFVKEKSKIPLNVTFEGGISPFSGLWDIASELGWIRSPSQAWYQRHTLDTETGEMKPMEDNKWRRKDAENNIDFWRDILQNETFKEQIRQKYKVAKPNMGNDEIDKELEGLL